MPLREGVGKRERERGRGLNAERPRVCEGVAAVRCNWKKGERVDFLPLQRVVVVVDDGSLVVSLPRNWSRRGKKREGGLTPLLLLPRLGEFRSESRREMGKGSTQTNNNNNNVSHFLLLAGLGHGYEVLGPQSD